MNPANLTKILRSNSLLWLAAMLLPALFHITLGETRFPWPVLLPLLLFGPILASNQAAARDPSPDKKDPA